MGIALFDEPPRVTITDPEYNSRNGLLLGFSEEGGLSGIVCLEGGSIARIRAAGFLIDYRYQVETDRWIDVNAQEADQEG